MRMFNYRKKEGITDAEETALKLATTSLIDLVITGAYGADYVIDFVRGSLAIAGKLKPKDII